MARDPFDVRLSAEQRKAVAIWICNELEGAIAAKGVSDQEVDYWHQLYEQARTRSPKNTPWPDAADLTSYLASEKVDSLLARLMGTIWSDPVCVVEGWGQSADRAPLVEEFHQWKVEEERLQGVLTRLALISLIEPRGLLEISEGTEHRIVRKTVNAKVKTDPITGGLYFDAEGNPEAEVDLNTGDFLEAQPGEASIGKVVDRPEPIRTGPVYRVLPYRDSIILPGHARDKEEIWAYGKKFWKRYNLVQQQAAAGVYDEEAVERMSSVSDRESDVSLSRANQAIVNQDRVAVEKELWELLVLCDLNHVLEMYGESPLRDKAYRGERWYLMTVHLPTQQILRVQHDDLERSRFVPVILFPRTDRATEGFSFVGHKLITTIEEHTAWRNMAADRAAMVIQAPIKRQVGALWDPLEQPFGPKAVIDVRDMREIEPFVMPDLSAPVFSHIQMMEVTADRIAGINDISAGQISSQDRTLGEIQLATSNADRRMDLVVRQFQEALEDIWQIRHAIWTRKLAENREGAEAPNSLIGAMEGRGISIDQYLPDGKITAELLHGSFRFKPRGSVQNADKARLRVDFMQFLQALPMVLQAFPMLAQMFMTPQAARAMGRQMLRVFDVENTQAFLGSPAQDLQQTIMGNMLPPIAQMMGGMPQGMGQGMPPGMPPGMQGGMPPPPMGGSPPGMADATGPPPMAGSM